MADYLDELVQRITTKANLKGFDDLNKAQRRAIKQNDLLGKSLRNAFGFFLGIQGVRSIIQTSREIDLLQRSIKGLTGSAQDFQYLRQEAYRTGTSLTQMGKAYKNFYSAAKMSGFNKNQIQGMFSDVLVAGRGIGANQQQIGGALLALEQMLSKGKVSMEELRRQMGNALPGAFEIAAKSMGVTTKEFNKMLEAGLDANTFVPRFTAMLKKELGKGFAENIKSLDFALVNLNTAWVEFQANIMQGDTGESFRQLVLQITQILRSQELYRGLQIISKGLGLIIRSLKWILLFWGFRKIVEITMAIRRLHQSLIGMAATTAVLGAATRTMVAGYAFLTSGQVINGIRMLAAGMWATVAPIVAVAGALGTVLGTLILILDAYETFVNNNPDSLLNRAMGSKTKKGTQGASTGLGAILGGLGGFAIGGPVGAGIGLIGGGLLGNVTGQKGWQMYSNPQSMIPFGGGYAYNTYSPSAVQNATTNTSPRIQATYSPTVYLNSNGMDLNTLDRYLEQDRNKWLQQLKLMQ